MQACRWAGHSMHGHACRQAGDRRMGPADTTMAIERMTALTGCTAHLMLEKPAGSHKHGEAGSLSNPSQLPYT